eukprot:s1182_g17.t2
MRSRVRPCWNVALTGRVLVYPKEPAAGNKDVAASKKPEAKAASVKDGLELQRQHSERVQLLQDADPEAAVQAGARRQRRIWLQKEGNPYTVFLDADAIVDDLRRLATPKLDDEERASVKLFKADGTELDLDGEVPLDAGSLSRSAIRVQGVAPQPRPSLPWFVLDLHELWGTYASL